MNFFLLLLFVPLLHTHARLFPRGKQRAKLTVELNGPGGASVHMGNTPGSSDGIHHDITWEEPGRFEREFKHKEQISATAWTYKEGRTAHLYGKGRKVEVIAFNQAENSKGEVQVLGDKRRIERLGSKVDDMSIVKAKGTWEQPAEGRGWVSGSGMLRLKAGNRTPSPDNSPTWSSASSSGRSSLFGEKSPRKDPLREESSTSAAISAGLKERPPKSAPSQRGNLPTHGSGKDRLQKGSQLMSSGESPTRQRHTDSSRDEKQLSLKKSPSTSGGGKSSSKGKSTAVPKFKKK